ncbi:MAG: threonine-phosphate decarboxylase CobD [Pseudomonadota bacterium]
MLEHGGRLVAAARQYGIPAADWLDLSTGINPLGWPAPIIPPELWTRLPQEDDGLTETACHYYGAPRVLPVAGSQAAIQALPALRPPGRVGIPHPTYAEHAHAWRRGGHEVVAWTPDRGPDSFDALVLIHPNNPTGTRYSTVQLLDWHARLAARGGWLVVDEAFMDPTPETSLVPFCDRDGLIVLRSLGKFFGLAGARVGFVMAGVEILGRLHEALGPWTVPGPSRRLAQQALADGAWQAAARPRLFQAGERLARLLAAHGLAPEGGTALFQWMRTPNAALIADRLARRGILVRRFDDPPSLRFGLPGQEPDWARLAQALAEAVA